MPRPVPTWVLWRPFTDNPACSVMARLLEAGAEASLIAPVAGWEPRWVPNTQLDPLPEIAQKTLNHERKTP